MEYEPCSASLVSLNSTSSAPSSRSASPRPHPSTILHSSLAATTGPGSAPAPGVDAGARLSPLPAHATSSPPDAADPFTPTPPPHPLASFLLSDLSPPSSPALSAFSSAKPPGSTASSDRSRSRSSTTGSSGSLGALVMPSMRLASPARPSTAGPARVLVVGRSSDERRLLAAWLDDDEVSVEEAEERLVERLRTPLVRLEQMLNPHFPSTEPLAALVSAQLTAEPSACLFLFSAPPLATEVALARLISHLIPLRPVLLLPPSPSLKPLKTTALCSAVASQLLNAGVRWSGSSLTILPSLVDDSEDLSRLRATVKDSALLRRTRAISFLEWREVEIAARGRTGGGGVVGEQDGQGRLEFSRRVAERRGELLGAADDDGYDSPDEDDSDLHQSFLTDPTTPRGALRSPPLHPLASSTSSLQSTPSHSSFFPPPPTSFHPEEVADPFHFPTLLHLVGLNLRLALLPAPVLSTKQRRGWIGTAALFGVLFLAGVACGSGRVGLGVGRLGGW